MNPPAITAPSVDVSVIIGSYNRADMLAETLASLTSLDTQLASGKQFTYEIVAIDNASTDHTQEVITRFAKEEKKGTAERVRSFVELEAGVTFARNRGLAEATGEWIAFHDDDQKAHAQWLAELLNLAAEKNVKVVGGAVQLSLPESNTRELAPQCRQLLGEKVGMDTVQPYSRKRIPGTNNLLLHRTVIEKVGVFDIQLTNGGEDADLFRRIRTAGYEAWYTPDAIVYHLIPEGRLSDEYMRWTAIRHGQHLALREYRDWGSLGLSGMFIIRTFQAFISYLPRFLLAKLTGQQEQALGARSLVWRSQAYLAHAWSLLCRGEVKASSHDESLNLREGRERLLKGAKASS